MVDTTNKHIGNVLSKMSDCSMKEILQQYMKRCQFNSDELLIKYFQEVLECDTFDYEGNIKKEKQSII